LDAVEPGLLPVGGLIEPLGVCGLFRGSLRRNGLQGAKQLNSPGIQVGPLSGPEQRPLEVNHGASVADELAGELRRRGRRYQLSGLVHLDDVDGLAARAAPGRVVARESQEHDEPEKDGEPCREDAEHAGRPSPSEKKLPSGANRRRRKKRPTASPTDATTIRTV
jgi:hypothetical protein